MKKVKQTLGEQNYLRPAEKCSGRSYIEILMLPTPYNNNINFNFIYFLTQHYIRLLGFWGFGVLVDF